MTKQELAQLAHQFEEEEYGDINLDIQTTMKVVHGYHAGFLKALELVLAALDAAPIYTHYDLDDALKPFQQLLS